MGRSWGLSESNPDVTESSLWLLLSCEGHAGGRRRREHRPRSSLERDEHWSVVGLALARWRNAPAGRRSLHSGSRSAWGTQLAATPEGGGSGSGGAAAGSGPGRPRLGRRGGLGDSGPLGSRRATRASAETMAKEEGDGCRAPTAAAGSGEGPGPGCGPRGAGRAGGRAGARAPEFAAHPGARREWPKVSSPGVGRQVEPKVGSVREEAGAEWRSCGSRLLRAGERDELGWVRVGASGAACEGSHPARGTEAGVRDGCAEADGVHLCCEG